jgi:pyruvate,orthophosphate dikinase
MKELLGGKGANLAGMCRLGLPVPAGLTITTECCNDYYANNCQLPAGLMDEVWKGMEEVEKHMGMKYGDPNNPMLMSARSGARSSMPGMIKKTDNPRFVYDSYRRLIMMFADVVMDKAEGLDKGIRRILDDMLETYKEDKGFHSDTELEAGDLEILAEQFKAKIK